jgi:hypothetical protein
MTKERPRPPVRRLPKRPDSEMRQERMKKAVKVDVCSQTSTSTLEGALSCAVVCGRVWLTWSLRVVGRRVQRG